MPLLVGSDLRLTLRRKLLYIDVLDDLRVYFFCDIIYTARVSHSRVYFFEKLKLRAHSLPSLPLHSLSPCGRANILHCRTLSGQAHFASHALCCHKPERAAHTMHSLHTCLTHRALGAATSRSAQLTP